MSKKGWLLTIFALLIAICAVSYVIFAMFNFNRPDTVGICYASATDGINASYRYALSQVLRQQGYAVLELDADNDQAKQLQQIKLMADRGCVALMIEPVMAAAASCQTPKPRGISSTAKGDATDARMEVWAISSSTSWKFQLKDCMICTRVLHSRMMVPALTM